MSFELSISELVKLVYEVPISYLIFYYFVLFISVSIIRKVLQIDIDGLDTYLGIFKLDKKTIPALLIIGWFGLLFNALIYINLFTNVTLKLVCVLSFLLCVLILRIIQIKLQFAILGRRYKQRGLITDEGRKTTYVKRSGFLYLDIFTSISVLLFILVFALIEFGGLSALLIATLAVVHYLIIITEQVHLLFRDLGTY